MHVFFTDKSLEKFYDIIYKIKENALYIFDLTNEMIRVTNKNVKLGVFIVIASNDNLVSGEAF